MMGSHKHKKRKHKHKRRRYSSRSRSSSGDRKHGKPLGTGKLDGSEIQSSLPDRRNENREYKRSRIDSKQSKLEHKRGRSSSRNDKAQDGKKVKRDERQSRNRYKRTRSSSYDGSSTNNNKRRNRESRRKYSKTDVLSRMKEKDEHKDESCSTKGEKRIAARIDKERVMKCFAIFETIKKDELAALKSLLGNLDAGEEVIISGIKDLQLKDLLEELFDAFNLRKKKSNKSFYKPKLSVCLVDFYNVFFQRNTSRGPKNENGEEALKKDKKVYTVERPTTATPSTPVMKEVSSDEDDDDAGPRVITDSKARKATVAAVHMSIAEASKIEKVETSDGKKRESWMTELPEDRPFVPSLQSGNRQFQTKTKQTDPNARSEWTAKPGETIKKSTKPQEGESIYSIADKQMKQKLDSFNKTYRGEALMTQHTNVLNGKNDGNDKKEWSWSRERDFVQGGTDKKYAEQILNDKHGLSTRFSGGSTKKFL